MMESPWPPLLPAMWCGALAAWTIWCGGKVARVTSISRLHRFVAGVTALLVLPGAVVSQTLGSTATASAVREGAWLWPLACLAAMPQPLMALGRDRALGWLAWPVIAWNAAALADAAARTIDFLGGAWPDALVPLLGAPRAAWIDAVGPSALTAPWTLWVPVLVPVWPPRVRLRRVVHVALVVVALTGAGASVLAGLRLLSVSSSYVRLGADPVRERPAGDFVIGVRAFGVVTDMVPATVARLDEQSLEQLEVGAVAVEVSAGASRAALDSLGRVLENRRRSGTDVVVVLRDVPSSAADSAAVASIARRTWASTLVLSGPWESMPLDRLTLAMERRAASARAAGRPGLQVALAVTADEPTRHAWAAERESGIDEVVLVLTSASSGADPLGRQLATWSAWIAETGALRNYWVYGTGAAPAAHGASSQRMAMRGVLAWATSERKVRGAILGPVSDLGALNGLRTTSYAWRPAAGAVLQAGRSIRESRAPAVAPAPVDSAVP